MSDHDHELDALFARVRQDPPVDDSEAFFLPPLEPYICTSC